MINIDINKVMGCIAVKPPVAAQHETALLDEFWCVYLNDDPETGQVTITDSSSATSQAWYTAAGLLFTALEAVATHELLMMTRAASKMDSDISGTVLANRLGPFYTMMIPGPTCCKGCLAILVQLTLKRQPVWKQRS
jgi:hypothetical protein